MKFIVLAGGSGTRLWPLSRKNFPKQFLKLHPQEAESFFQKTLKRLSFYEEAEFFVVTNNKHKFYVINQIEEISKKLKNDPKFEIIL
ncbi:MAG: sugar phosphate nucleotidyltransferase, partial [Thermodesulfovibrio sp.]